MRHVLGSECTVYCQYIAVFVPHRTSVSGMAGMQYVYNGTKWEFCTLQRNQGDRWRRIRINVLSDGWMSGSFLVHKSNVDLVEVGPGADLQPWPVFY